MARVIGNLFDIARETSELVSWSSALLRHVDRADAKVKFKTLLCYATGSAARYGTFREYGASAGYTPGVGKVFISLAAKGRFNVNAATTLLVYGSGSDVGFSSGTSAPTGTDAADGTQGIRIDYQTTNATYETEAPAIMRITAGRYISMLGNSSGSFTAAITLIGYEIDTTITSLDEV